MADIDPQILMMLAQHLGGQGRMTPDVIEGIKTTLAAQQLSGALAKQTSQENKMQQGQGPTAPPFPAQQIPSQQGQEMAPPGPPPPGIQGPRPQLGGQVAINKQIPGPGPLRSGVTPDQIQRLAQLLSMPGMTQQMMRMPQMPGHSRAPAQGIPNVAGPKLAV